MNNISRHFETSLKSHDHENGQSAQSTEGNPRKKLRDDQISDYVRIQGKTTAKNHRKECAKEQNVLKTIDELKDEIYCKLSEVLIVDKRKGCSKCKM